MDIGNANTTILQEESTLGIYVWEMPDGRWIGDDDGNFLSITSKKGNRSRIDALAREVLEKDLAAFIDVAGGGKREAGSKEPKEPGMCGRPKGSKKPDD